MGWKRGGTYFHGIGFTGLSSCTDSRGCKHLAGISADGLTIYHMIRGSRSPYPVEAYQIVPEGKVIGTPSIGLSHIGTIEIACALEGGGIGFWWAMLDEFTDPSGDEPPPAKCPDPYHAGGKLRIFIGSMLSGLAMKETPEWPDARLPEYYNALVKDGVNAERNFSTCAPGDPYDPLDYWRFNDPEYLTVIKSRLALIKERDLTEIICLTPYRGSISDDEARWLVRELKSYLPNIIFECVNEPTENERQRRLVEILKAEGIPNKFIQVQHVDSGAFYDLLHDTLNGEGLATYHWTGTLETINAPWPKGWSTSSGMMTFMTMGLYGSNDGQDTMRAALGLNFWLHDHQNPPITEYRRPNNWQLGKVSAWFRAHGKGHVEHLSASAYQRSAKPNMDDALSIGHEERLAMAL